MIHPECGISLKINDLPNFSFFWEFLRGHTKLSLKTFNEIRHVAISHHIHNLGNGVTHYTHWFQPLTEGTAEKHDAFVEWVWWSVWHISTVSVCSCTRSHLLASMVRVSITTGASAPILVYCCMQQARLQRINIKKAPLAYPCQGSFFKWVQDPSEP